MSSLRSAIHAKSIPKPTGAGIVNLKMADGGEVSPFSLRGMGQAVTRFIQDNPVERAASRMVASPAEKRANDSLRAPVASPPVAAVQPQDTPAPMGSSSVMERREKAAGLRNGGELHLLSGGPGDSVGFATSTPEMEAAAAAAGQANMAQYNKSISALQAMNGTTPGETTAKPSLRGPVAGLPMAQPMMPSGDAWAAGALQNGGTVPGHGSGDKVPAMYEPGEFVVSNDMLKADPSLRGELHDLRAAVLAKKGMTPAEADAKAVHFETNQGEANERAAVRQGGKGDGEGTGPQHVQTNGQSGRPEALGKQTVGAVGVRGGGNHHHGSQVHSLRGPVVHALHGIEVTERPATNAEWQRMNPPEAHAERVNPTRTINQPEFHGDGRYGAPAGGAPVGEAPPKPTPYARGVDAANKLKGSWGAAMNNPVLRGAQRLAGGLGAYNEGTAAADAYQAGNTVEAVDHGLQSVASLASTSANPWIAAPGMAYGAGYMAGTAIYNNTGRDKQNVVGSGMNKVAQLFGGGVNDAALRQVNSADFLKSTPAPTAKPADPAQQPPTKLPTNQRGQNFLDPRRTDVNPADPRLGQSRDMSAELNGAKAALPSDLREGVVHKTVDAQGRVTYSGRNVGVNGNGETQMVDGRGRDLKMLNGNNSNYAYSVDANGKRNGPMVSAFSDGQIGSTSTGADGGLRGPQSGNPLHEARMAAANRGDWDAVNASLAAQGQGPVRGTQSGGGGNSPRDMIMNRLRGAGRLSVTGLKLANELNNSDNQLRGHQMQYDSSMTGHNIAREGHQATAANNRARLQYDMGKDQRDYNASQHKTAFEHQQKGAEAFEKSLTSLYPGEDGKGDQKQIATHRQMATNYVNDLVQTLRKSGDHENADKLAQAGPGSLSTDHHAELNMAMRTRAALEKANGWMPTTGGFKDSTHPKAWRPSGYEKRPVGGDHVIFPGGHISVNDLRNTPFYNPTGGTTDFDQLIADAQKAEAKRKGTK